MYTINPDIESMYCIKCGEKFPVGDYFTGCPSCLGKGENSSLSFRYRASVCKDASKKGMLKYSTTLPYLSFSTLGEGDTPIITLDRMARSIGLKQIFVKNEFQNPTGSHKDRMSTLAVARALHLGKKTIVAASSGNAGISLAAYAANSELECKIISPRSINTTYKAALEAIGAELIHMDKANDTVRGRWDYMRKMVEGCDWYPATNYIIPPVGSNCFGVQGYKTISYEIYEYFGEGLPEFILVPVSRGDLLWGIYEGLRELQQLGYIKNLPKLVCVEPFERLTKALAGEDYRKSFPGEFSLTPSIGGTTVTYQAYAAIKGSDGFAIDVPQRNVIDDIRSMAHNGLYLEASSAVALSALKKAIQQEMISRNSQVLIIATSNGFKNN